MKRIVIIFLFWCLGWTGCLLAQDTVTFVPVVNTFEVDSGSLQDTVMTIDERDLPDLRSRLEELNVDYQSPIPLNERLRKLLTKDELRMSPEATWLISRFYDRSNQFGPDVTFRDTIIVNPLFLPILFKGNYLPKNLVFYDTKALDPKYKPAPLMPNDTIAAFKDYLMAQASADSAHRYVETHYPMYFRYTQASLPQDAVKAKVIKKEITEDFPLVVTKDVTFDNVEAPTKFIPERRYWTSSFESSLQVAQNYISPNWHKGGASSLNLNHYEFFEYDYKRDRIKITNSLKIKNNISTAPNDTLRNYKVSDDLFQIKTNVGYQAFSKWYYTFDFDFSTQILSSFEENSNVKLAGLLAPYSITVGLGMKYDLNKTFKQKHKSLTFNVNIAPLSYTFRQTIDENIKLDKHFQKKADGTLPTVENLLGSSVEVTLNFQINRSISWYSQFKYKTSYARIEGDWENRFTFAWSRFFSSNITLNMRYDDGVAKNEDFDSYLQINELLSFGFNYKW